jgi:HTH-type transcriptional regulator, competence development regulator
MQEKGKLLEQNFGIALRRWRNEAGISLQKLADKTGMSFTYLAKIERGELPPPVEKKLLRLAKKLRRSKDEVLNVAGRLPADVILIAQREPARYAKLVRGTRNLSPNELDRVIHRALSEVARVFREKKNLKRKSTSGGQ